MSGSQLENADGPNSSEEVDPFLEPLIATTLRDWLNALPEDFSSALGPVSQDEQPGDFAEMVKMLADIEQNSPAALQIYKDMGPSGLIRMFARFASDLGEFAADAILKMYEYAPSEVGHALELFQDVLARRAVGVIGNDPAFITAMETVIPSQRLDQNVSQRNQG
jgi:hypothetical protein